MPARNEPSASSVNSSPLGRRSFVKGISALGLGLALGSTSVPASLTSPRRRYTLVGSGELGQLYRDAIRVRYPRVAELVEELSPDDCSPEEFEKRLAQKSSESVIVATSCAQGCGYTVRALHAGCDVIMDTGAARHLETCTSVLQACKRTGRTVRVALPHRYLSANTQVKNLLVRGEIGELLSVDFTCSRPLVAGDPACCAMDDKAEHFDLLNWWIGVAPVQVRLTPPRRHASADTQAVQVSYADGVTLSYSEKNCEGAGGYKVAFNGTKGRLEQSRNDALCESLSPWTNTVSFFGRGAKTRHFPLRGQACDNQAQSDDRRAAEAQMLDDLFSSGVPVENCRRCGDEWSLPYALAMGNATRRAVDAGQAVELAHLISGFSNVT